MAPTKTSRLMACCGCRMTASPWSKLVVDI